MKKKWKIAITLISLVLLSGAIYFTYILKFKQYDVADEEVKEIISDPYTIELPDGSFITIDEDGEVVESTEPPTATGTAGQKQPVAGQNGATATTGSSDKGSTSSNSNSNSNSNNNNNNNSNSNGSSNNNSNKENPPTGSTSDKKTVATIKEKYVPVFTNLQSQADVKISSLIGHAKAEYSAKKASGESISYPYFYNKYMGAAKDLESRTDAIFYGTIKAVEADLGKNGYNKSYAKSFIDEYEATKKERRDGILKKAVER